MSHTGVKYMFLNFQFLEKSQLALREATGDLLQNNLRCCKKISRDHKSRFHARFSEMHKIIHLSRVLDDLCHIQTSNRCF